MKATISALPSAKIRSPSFSRPVAMTMTPYLPQCRQPPARRSPQPVIFATIAVSLAAREAHVFHSA